MSSQAMQSEPPAPVRTTRRSWLRPGRLLSLVPYLLLIGLLAVYDHNVEDALSRESLAIMIAGGLTLALVSAGQTIVILTGGIDLSVGGVISVATVLAASHFEDNWTSIALWSLAIVGVGVLAGVLNGFLVVGLGLQPFIVTLATWSLWSGIAFWIQPIEGGEIPIRLLVWVNESPLGIGMPIWFLGALLLGWVLIRRTALLFRIRAMGSSPDAAYLSGVSPLVTISAAYAISGGLAALAGLFLATQISSGSPGAGEDFILSSVAAVVIGGASLLGGRGSAAASVAGSYVLTLAGSVVFVLGYSSQFEDVIRALILVGAILAVSGVTLLQRRRSGRLA